MSLHIMSSYRTYKNVTVALSSLFSDEWWSPWVGIVRSHLFQYTLKHKFHIFSFQLFFPIACLQQTNKHFVMKQDLLLSVKLFYWALIVNIINLIHSTSAHRGITNLPDVAEELNWFSAVFTNLEVWCLGCTSGADTHTQTSVGCMCLF